MFIYNKLDTPTLPDNTKDVVFIEATGQIYTHGKYFPKFTQSEAVDKKYSKDVTKAVTTEWSDFTTIANISNTFETGTYAIQITYSTNMFSGTFSYTGSGSDEIVLHQAGTGTRIFVKTDGTKLQIAGAAAITSTTYTINLRKLL